MSVTLPAEENSNFDEPVGGGIYMIIGHVDSSDTEVLHRWEYWLTLARMVVISRPLTPDDACMAKVAMIDHMETIRLASCHGLIVCAGVPRKGDTEPFVSLHDYKLIMQALHLGKRVLTTKPLVDKDKTEERVWKIDSLDPDAPDTLWEFTWEDYKAKFSPKKRSEEGPLVLNDPINGGKH